MTEKRTETRYYRGFPGRLKREVERGLIGHALKFSFRFACLAFVLTYGAVTALCLYNFVQEKRLIILPVAAVTGVIFAWLANRLWEAWFRPDPGPRILPYFQKISGVERLGGVDTYLHGYAIARSCQALDTLAAELNLQLLSDFGFNDDHRGEEPKWHPAEAGLSTITGLLQELLRLRRLSEGLRADFRRGNLHLSFSFILRELETNGPVVQPRDWRRWLIESSFFHYFCYLLCQIFHCVVLLFLT